MRTYKVNKIEHTVFESADEVPNSIDYLYDWRKGGINNWVLSDDGCIIQIIREGTMSKAKGKNRHQRYIGTCTGTFIVSNKTKMDTSRRVNIYSIGGHVDREQRIVDRENMSSREHMFVQYLASGMDARKAYLKAFPTNDPHYAGLRAGQLVKTTRIKTAMKEELKPILEELGINESSILKNINSIAMASEKDETKLKALFKLADIMDMEDKSKTQVTQLTGAVFQGFSKDKITEAERPKELKNGGL
tara:strand:- start:3277 stop:4017 length:741 start_codon:yes stop_codon:yes gene_type:complete